MAGMPALPALKNELTPGREFGIQLRTYI